MTGPAARRAPRKRTGRRRTGGWNPALAGAAAALALILCAGPLAFGGVLVRERTGLQICAFLALALAVAGRWRDRQTVPGAEPLATASFVPPLAIATIGVWGVLQSLPLPEAVARLTAPTVAGAWEVAAAHLGDQAATPRLSLAPAVSRQTGLQWLAAAACMATATLASGRRTVRRVLAGTVLATAFFEVLFGADKWLARSEVMWGMTVAGDPGRLRGTFINANHLAFYLLPALAIALAASWWSGRRIARVGRTRRASLEMLVLYAFLPALLFLVFFAGIAFTGSRAGLLAAVAAILTFAALLAIHYRRWRVGLLASSAVVLGVAGVLLFGARQGLERWAATSAYDVTWSSRWTVYRATWDLWRDVPWTGTGLGTFREAFSAVQPKTLDGIWVHAHSDVLEILATAGLVAVPVLAIGLGVLGRRLFAVFEAGSRSEDRAAGLAAMVALAGALLHSTLDFALTLPANAFTLSAVCGLALGVPVPGRSRSLS